MSLHGYLLIGTLAWLTTFALGNRKWTVMVPESWGIGSCALIQLVTNPAPPPPQPPPHRLSHIPCGFVLWVIRFLASCAQSPLHSPLIARKYQEVKTWKIFFTRCPGSLPRLRLKSSGRGTKVSQSSRLHRCWHIFCGQWLSTWGRRAKLREMWSSFPHFSLQTKDYWSLSLGLRIEPGIQ